MGRAVHGRDARVLDRARREPHSRRARSRFSVRLAGALCAATTLVLSGCGRHLVGTHDVAIGVHAAEGANPRLDPTQLARHVARRLLAGRVEADVDATHDGAQIVVDADERETVLALLRWKGLEAHRIVPGALPAIDRTALVSHTDRAPDGATDSYFTGSPDAIRAAVARARGTATPVGTRVDAQWIDDTHARTRQLDAAPLALVPAGSTRVRTEGGDALLLDVDDAAVAQALGHARDLVGSAPVALVIDDAVVDVAPLPARDATGRVSLHVAFGRGLHSFTRAHRARRLLESPLVPDLAPPSMHAQPVRRGLATLSIVLPLLLSLAWLAFVRRFDRARPEPWWLVGATFVLGALSSVPVAFAEIGLARLSPYLDPSLMTLGGQTRAFALALFAFVVTVGLIEEGGKLLGTWSLAWRRREFDEPIDGIVYGAASALGFAAAENLKYFTDGRLQSGLVALRALESIPVHLFCGAIWGYGLGRRLVDGRVHVLRYWVVAAVLHGLFDTCLSIERTPVLASVEMLCLATVFVVLLRRALRYGAIVAEERGRIAGPRRLFFVGSYPRFLTFVVLVHVLGAAIVAAGISAEIRHHRPDAWDMLVIGLLVAAMGLSARALVDNVPLDAALDESGVTFGGARWAWRSIVRVSRDERRGRSTLVLHSGEGTLRIGPTTADVVATIEAAVRTQIDARGRTLETPPDG